MKVQYVPIAPVEGVSDIPPLTPELHASVLARHSRSSEGINAIVDKVDLTNPQKAVDQIFRHIDYGHKSIADMAPITLNIEGVSVATAAWIWQNSHCGAGQQTSTRYVKTIDKAYGMGEEIKSSKYATEIEVLYNKYLEFYVEATEIWTEAAKNTNLNIPQSILSHPKADLKIETIRRNWVLDRARYFLPCSLRTNLGILQNSNEWVNICSLLLSEPENQFEDLVKNNIVPVLEQVSPSCTKYISPRYEGTSLVLEKNSLFGEPLPSTCVRPFRSIDIKKIPNWTYWRYGSYKQRSSKLDPIDNGYKKCSLTYSASIPFCEYQDLVRHRPGEFFIPGKWASAFYFAVDQANTSRVTEKDRKRLRGLAKAAQDLAINHINTIDRYKHPSNYYDHQNYFDTLWGCPMGTHISFTRECTAYQLIYEIELRTGPGSHYNYRNYYTSIFDKFGYQLGKVFVGEGEVEA